MIVRRNIESVNIMNSIFIYSIILLGGLGLFFGIGLAVAAKIFHVTVNPKIEEIMAVLPGANCGACGYPSCEEFAKAVLKGEAPVDGCKVGREKVAEKVKAVLEGKL